MRSTAIALGLFVAVPVALLSCAGQNTHATAPRAVASIAPPTLADAAPNNYPGIHNVVAYHEGFYSGGVPEGAEGLETLAAMGIKTIISVDGATPDVARAKSLGMRYIHLPIGYNGFDETRKIELSRATRDAMKAGPVYIHCHHGKHRSAGAAAAVAASLGWMTPEAAVERMKVSGTAPGYKGLYTCAMTSAPLSEQTLNSVNGKFPEISRPGTFVAGMVGMDDAVERLKSIEKAGWKVPADHPDLVPAAEAGRVADLLRISAAGDRAKRGGEDFTAGLARSGELSQTLEDMLAQGEPDAAKLSAQFALVQKSCKACHEKFRD